jgi:hypothetical protein
MTPAPVNMGLSPDKGSHSVQTNIFAHEVMIACMNFNAAKCRKYNYSIYYTSVTPKHYGTIVPEKMCKIKFPKCLTGVCS